MRIFLCLFLVAASLGFSISYNLLIPKGFPTPYIPENNLITEKRVELGKKLFFDNILSRDSTLSCSTCHLPQYAFTDRRPKSIGIDGRIVSRNAPTLTNVAYQKHFLLDGLNPSLEAQVKVPIHEHNEFDFHILLVAERMKKNNDYVRLSRQAYGVEPSPKVISDAIACYERTLISGNAPYDQYFFQGNLEALSPSEKRGMKLFFDDLYCSSCHGGFNFTNGALTNNGLYSTYEDKGRARLSHKDSDLAIFKVPTLRNIGLTYPYMHDGSLSTLSQVIDHYSSGGANHPNKDSVIIPFSLSVAEKHDLISFLNSLTDSSFIDRHY